jgi:hypothetical protein
MSMQKHTPGPWTAKDESGQYFCDHDWHAESDSASLSCSAPIHANGEVVAIAVTEGWSDAKIDANARLIAAAPDLLDALESLVEGMDASGIKGSYLESARAAIAKARSA